VDKEAVGVEDALTLKEPCFAALVAAEVLSEGL
jgi:hypothetical protein